MQLTYHIAKAVIAFDIHRLVQSSHSLHTSSQSLAPVPPLPEKGGQVRHGIIPEELFQLLYPKTGVTGMWALEGWVSCIYYLLNIIMTYLLSTGNIILMVFDFFFFCLIIGVFFLLGPYMLGTGLLVYLLSKEIYIVNHETLSAISIGAVVIYGIKKFGPSVAAFADKLNEVGF